MSPKKLPFYEKLEGEPSARTDRVGELPGGGLYPPRAARLGEITLDDIRTVRRPEGNRVGELPSWTPGVVLAVAAIGAVVSAARLQFGHAHLSAEELSQVAQIAFGGDDELNGPTVLPLETGSLQAHGQNE